MVDIAEVDVKSAWVSKINWTQVVSIVATFATLFGFDISPELQVKIVGAIGVVMPLVTIVMKTWFTTTITPSSAAKV